MSNQASAPPDPNSPYIELEELLKLLPATYRRRPAIENLDKAGLLHHVNRKVRWVILERLEPVMPHAYRVIMLKRAMVNLEQDDA